jgi:hypothetical protein
MISRVHRLGNEQVCADWIWATYCARAASSIALCSASIVRILSAWHAIQITGASPGATTAERLAAAERRVADACREAGIYAIVGTPLRDGDKLYDSATVIDPPGKVIDRYHKVG